MKEIVRNILWVIAITILTLTLIQTNQLNKDMKELKENVNYKTSNV